MRKLSALLVGSLLLLIAVTALSQRSHAQSPRYMATPDAPGSVWRINMETGELEHCSLIKSGCDVVDRND